MKYLLLKLAEEAGEVVVAAIKHRLHRTDATRRELEGELADLIGVMRCLCDEHALNLDEIHRLGRKRHLRETERARNR